MILRAAIVAAALAVAVLAVTRHGHVHECDRALQDSYHAAPGDEAAATEIARRLREHCRGSDELASAAAALGGRGDPAAARALALAATRREPDNARAWLGLAFALRRSDPPGARRAQARATALNPYAARVAP